MLRVRTSFLVSGGLLCYVFEDQSRREEAIYSCHIYIDNFYDMMT